MLRRFALLLTALTMIGAVALAGVGLGEPMVAAAAGGYGVGPSQTGATGTARACQATATNYGRSYGNGLNCPASIVASLTANGDGTFTYTVTGTGLYPNSDVTICYSNTQGITNQCLVQGTADASGNYSYISVIPCSAFPSTYVETDTFSGTAANGTPYTSPTYTLAVSSVCP